MDVVDKERLMQLFPVKKNCLYFNFAADGPLPVPAKDAVCQALEEKSRQGMIAVPKQIAVYEEVHRELAALFQSKAENFAFCKNTSEGVLLALLTLDIKEDENYIVAEDAFPTTIHMMKNNSKGELRTVTINDPVPVQDQLAKVIDQKTKALVLDWVHFATGKVIDIEAITQLAREKSVFTVIDGIQGAGARNLELDASCIDFFVSGGHKWMLSPQGSGFIYVSPRVWEKIPRRSFGWLGYDWFGFSDFKIRPKLRDGAAVMEYGTRSYTAAVGFRECLKLINQVGIKNIEKHNQTLRNYFVENLLKKGYATILNENAASIVPFKPVDPTGTQRLSESLNEKNVRLSLRNGYIRAAFHWINHRDELDTFLHYL